MARKLQGQAEMEQENKLRRNMREVLQESVSEERKDLQEGQFSLIQPFPLEAPIWNKVLKFLFLEFPSQS